MSTTLTANYNFIKPAPGTEKDVWGPYLNTNADNIDTQIKNRANEIALRALLAGDTFTGRVNFPASTATGSAAGSIRVPTGVAPTSPTEGDMWKTATNFVMRINGLSQNNITDQFATFLTKVITPASVAGSASLNVPHGVAPSAPVNGDIWSTTTAIYGRVNGVTVQLATSTDVGAYLPLAGGTLTGLLTTRAAVAGGASINVPHGTAPTSPVNGDFWSTTAAFFGRVNGTTVQLSVVGHTHLESDITNLVSDLAAKAPLASPALTGTPTVPTAAPGTNTTQAASTAFVTAAVTAGSTTPAAASDVWTGTDNAKMVTSKAAADANLEQTLTDGATITVNFAAGINFGLASMAGNRTLAASGLSSALIGRSGYIKIVQDATGNRTLNTSGATWKNVNQEDVVLSTGAGQIDYLFYTILSSTTVLLSIARNVG